MQLTVLVKRLEVSWVEIVWNLLDLSYIWLRALICTLWNFDFVVLEIRYLTWVFSPEYSSIFQWAFPLYTKSDERSLEMATRLQNLYQCKYKDMRNAIFQDAGSEYSQRSPIGHWVQKIKIEVLCMQIPDLLSELQYHAYNSKYLRRSDF